MKNVKPRASAAFSSTQRTDGTPRDDGFFHDLLRVYMPRRLCMFNEAPVRLQMRARRKDGASAEVELSIGMVHGIDGRLTHWVLAFADRSEIERMREELRILRSIAAAP